MAMSQALALTADLKLGWYTSIPPREMFTCQIIGTVLGALTNCVSLLNHPVQSNANVQQMPLLYPSWLQRDHI